jgi:hypothetical protein
MRNWYLALLLLLGGFGWYATTGTAAQAQLDPAAIGVGEKVTLYVEKSGGGLTCEVIDVRGGFVGCKASSDGFNRPAKESWYNLRFVTVIEKAAAR